MNSWEFYSRIEMFKHTQKDDELAHYGITGQKWGKRRWQNADGTFNAEGKERYFGTKSSSSSDDKMGGARSNVKDYLKFRNKMLKKHAKADMDKWYIEEHKEDDKKLLKDAKRIDKSAKKMYENQLKDYYDNPNDLVDDLNKVYKFGGNNKNQKFGSSESHWKQLDESNRDSYGKSEEQYWKDKEKAEKYLDENYDKDFTQVIKDDYDTTGEWGDVDAAYEQFKENPYEYLKKYSRDPKYNISDKEEKRLAKEAAKLDKAIAKGNDSIAEIMLSDRANNIKEETNKIFNDKYAKEADKLKELFDDYDKDDANEKITAITGFTNGLTYSDKLGDLVNSVYGYVYDDFDQGAGNSGYIYMLEKGYSNNDIRNMCKSNYENTQKFKSDIDTIIEKDPLLGKLSKTNKIRLRNPISAGELRMNNSKIREYDDNSYRLQEVGEGMSGNYSENVHKNLPEAKKLYSKVEKACSGKEYGWWYLNKAVQDLGLTNVNYKDLTDSDWNKINAKIRELG